MSVLQRSDERYSPPITRIGQAPVELTVPVAVWKQGMYCIELPEIRGTDPEACVPVVWSATQKGAELLAQRAIDRWVDTVSGVGQSRKQMDKAAWNAVARVDQ